MASEGTEAGAYQGRSDGQRGAGFRGGCSLFGGLGGTEAVAGQGGEASQTFGLCKRPWGGSQRRFWKERNLPATAFEVGVSDRQSQSGQGSRKSARRTYVLSPEAAPVTHRHVPALLCAPDLG